MIHVTDKDGRTALVLACRIWDFCDIELVCAVISAKANINAPDSYGYTALISAAESRNMQLIRLLISAIMAEKLIPSSSEKSITKEFTLVSNHMKITFFLNRAGKPCDIDRSLPY